MTRVSKGQTRYNMTQKQGKYSEDLKKKKKEQPLKILRHVAGYDRCRLAVFCDNKE